MDSVRAHCRPGRDGKRRHSHKNAQILRYRHSKPSKYQRWVLEALDAKPGALLIHFTGYLDWGIIILPGPADNKLPSCHTIEVLIEKRWIERCRDMKEILRTVRGFGGQAEHFKETYRYYRISEKGRRALKGGQSS